jgi:hypothetical protein
MYWCGLRFVLTRNLSHREGSVQPMFDAAPIGPLSPSSVSEDPVKEPYGSMGETSSASSHPCQDFPWITPGESIMGK